MRLLYRLCRGISALNYALLNQYSPVPRARAARLLGRLSDDVPPLINWEVCYVSACVARARSMPAQKKLCKFSLNCGVFVCVLLLIVLQLPIYLLCVVFLTPFVALIYSVQISSITFAFIHFIIFVTNVSDNEKNIINYEIRFLNVRNNKQI